MPNGIPEKSFRYFIINKPRDMVSQFVSPDPVRLLGALDFDFPEGIHAVGRLDNESEGLLILTNNKKVTRLLFSANEPHRRVYLVQINHVLSDDNLQKLREGVAIKIEGGEQYITPPCEVNRIDSPEIIYPFIKTTEQYGAHSWITIALYEGKFRQVRKMVKAINHRCKRLIRITIEDLELGNLPPGEVKEIDEKVFFNLLKINNF